MSRGSRCRGCGVGLRFVRVENSGRVMPVDPAPDEDGNVIARMVSGVLTGHVLTKDEETPPGWQRYMPHFATCPASDRRSKRLPPPEPASLFDDAEESTTPYESRKP